MLASQGLVLDPKQEVPVHWRLISPDSTVMATHRYLVVLLPASSLITSAQGYQWIPSCHIFGFELLSFVLWNNVLSTWQDFFSNTLTWQNQNLSTLCFPTCLEILLVHEIQTRTLIKTLLLFSHLGKKRRVETESGHSMPPPLPKQWEPTVQWGREWIVFSLRCLCLLTRGRDAQLFKSIFLNRISCLSVPWHRTEENILKP